MLGTGNNRELNYPFRQSRKNAFSQAEDVVDLKDQTTCSCCSKEALKSFYTFNNISLLICNDCGFITKKLSHEELLTEKLGGFLYPGGSDNIPQSTEFLKTSLSWLIGKNLNILDFGCGESKVPDKLRKKGHKVVALDSGVPENKHPDRYVGSLDDLPFNSRYFDLIYSYQSFERITEPKITIKKLFRLLTDEGLLLICTDMEAAHKVQGEVLLKNFRPSNKICSYYNFENFENMIDQLGHKIIYRNPEMFIARK